MSPSGRNDLVSFAIWSVAFVDFSMPTEAIVALDPATLACFAFKWPLPQRLKGGPEVRVGPGTYMILYEPQKFPECFGRSELTRDIKPEADSAQCFVAQGLTKHGAEATRFMMWRTLSRPSRNHTQLCSLDST